MDWTARGDLQESRSLRFGEIPFQPDLALDLIEHDIFRLAVLTVLGMNPRMA